MHDASPEFINAVTGDYPSAELIEFIYPEGDTPLAFDVVDNGDFQLDSSAKIRHNASFRIQARDVSPAVLRKALDTPGIRARYSRGMVRLDGEMELKTVLTGEIATGEIGWSRGGLESLPITVFDSFTRLEWPAAAAFAVPPGRNYVTAIISIISNFAPQMKWGNIMTTTFVTPALLFATDTNVSDAVTDMAEAIGGEIFMDALNQLNIAPVPVTVGRTPTWTFNCDEPGSGVTNIRVKTTNDEMANGVIVVGQHSSGGIVQGVAWDMNQGSRTYRDGEFGRRARRRPTEKVITQSQANTMAKASLEKELGGSQEIILQIVPNTLLTLGDLCTVISSEFDIHDDFIIRAISGGAGRKNITQPMTVTLRRGINPTTGEAI